MSDGAAGPSAAIVVVGTELTLGFSLESNSVFLARELSERGYKVVSVRKVPDDIGLLATALREEAASVDVIIVTGGLGSTHDDITRDALAEVSGAPLVRHEGAYAAIEKRRPGSADSSAFMRQAFLPEGATAIMPDGGTAPGILLEFNGALVFSLPGVPREMEGMLAFVFEKLGERYGSLRPPAIARLFLTGCSEPEAARLIDPALHAHPAIDVNILAKVGQISLTAKSWDGEQELAPAVRMMKAALGELIFSTGEKSLPEVVGGLLSERGLTLATAESLTGGLIGARIVEAAGASEYFKGAVVAYADEVKAGLLGVDPEILRDKGAVSAETAAAMADGARRALNTDIGLSVTGIAGPTGATADKPVGLVYTAISHAGESRSFRDVYTGDRSIVRQKAVARALNVLRLYLSESR